MARLFRDGRKVNMGGLCYPYVSGFWDWGLIRFFGNGCLGFRPDGGSLLKSPEAGPVKSKQNAFAPPLGASPRLGMPERRHCSVGRREGPSMAQRG